MWRFSLEMMKMTYKELLQWGEKELEEANVPEGKWDAWLLFSHVFAMDRGRYFLVMNQEIQAEQIQTEKIQQYQCVVDRRRQRIPLQHITGEQEFMGYTFRVNEDVLVPRQDTEALVETVWDEIIQRKNSGTDKSGKMHVMDMCTGSGCIAVSLCKMYQERYGQELDMTAVDVCEKALLVAGENARLQGCEAIQWIQSDLFAWFMQKNNKNNSNNSNNKIVYDIIVSNPPYIPTKAIVSLEEEVKYHDPWKALDGKEDGLYFYENIIKQSVGFTIQGGMLAFEIGCEQGAAVKSMMEQAGYRQVKILKDLAGLDRVVKGYAS